ncbi:hypothetical protein OOK31_37225 [Streptomyces sp. NBC_00249]|uniref:hypothetical protein n=1 Tax=Streptomyces sp. NBC_00249 TaxID=2975690 RepID=UPI002251C272|nr:hypothetical protein [Streptomyces sp. NBC_00249]MCX5199454.1 hypothetical protein [Streptomyces sp. NBC_00249]
MLDTTTTTTTRTGGAVPAWTTALTVLLLPVAFLFGGLAPMAADSCGPDHCSRSLDNTLAAVYFLWLASWTATPALTLASWFAPHPTARRWTAWTALFPPATVILLTLGL